MRKMYCALFVKINRKFIVAGSCRHGIVGFKTKHSSTVYIAS